MWTKKVRPITMATLAVGLGCTLLFFQTKPRLPNENEFKSRFRAYLASRSDRWQEPEWLALSPSALWVKVPYEGERQSYVCEVDCADPEYVGFHFYRPGENNYVFGLIIQGGKEIAHHFVPDPDALREGEVPLLQSLARELYNAIHHAVHPG
jgi:hypothetical protein